MRQLKYIHGVYQTSPRRIGLLGRWFPSVVFYTKMMTLCGWGSFKCRLNRYDRQQWATCSYDIIKAFESVGVSVEISGIEHLERLEKPVVILANHMSMLETLFLPAIVQPIQDMSYVAKQSLLDYPIFKHLVRFGGPIGVSRTNPRQDLKAVLEGGAQRLEQGVSMVIFPQTTRTTHFDETQFTTIGIKLARKAHVSVLPLALKTDAWSNGSVFKDFGRIDPSKRVRFSFGAPMHLEGPGTVQQQKVIAFIGNTLEQWRREEKDL